MFCGSITDRSAPRQVPHMLQCSYDLA